MIMRTGQILKGQAMDGACLGMAMAMTIARVRRAQRVERLGGGKGNEQRMEFGKGMDKGMGK
jgi:hypothetical protein